MSIHKHRSPPSQDDWSEAEMKVLLGYHCAGFNAEEVQQRSFNNRTPGAVARKASEMGIKLRGKKKC